MNIELKTVAVRADGCYGVLLADGRPFAVTVERTFENNRTVLENGQYHCERSVYHRGGYPTFEIMVDGHSRVLFHKGNVEIDSEGCVLVAESFGVMNGQAAISDSKGGFAEFWELTKAMSSFVLTVSGR